MYGLFQTTYYFGYMAVFSVGMGLMCGECEETGRSDQDCRPSDRKLRFECLLRASQLPQQAKLRCRLQTVRGISFIAGALGYLGTSLFVHKIYTYVKID